MVRMDVLPVVEPDVRKLEYPPERRRNEKEQDKFPAAPAKQRRSLANKDNAVDRKCVAEPEGNEGDLTSSVRTEPGADPCYRDERNADPESQGRGSFRLVRLLGRLRQDRQ